MDTFAGICSVLEVGADELLWGKAGQSAAVLDMWGSAKKGAGKNPCRADGEQADSYAMYVRIMKSVAEIMNEA